MALDLRALARKTLGQQSTAAADIQYAPLRQRRAVPRTRSAAD